MHCVYEGCTSRNTSERARGAYRQQSFDGEADPRDELVTIQDCWVRRGRRARDYWTLPALLGGSTLLTARLLAVAPPDTFDTLNQIGGMFLTMARCQHR